LDDARLGRTELPPADPVSRQFHMARGGRRAGWSCVNRAPCLRRETFVSTHAFANRQHSSGVPFWNEVYCLVLGTPLPCRVQNLENKRVKLSLCARSLSLQELHAKSRQHGSYGCARRTRRSVLGLAGLLTSCLSPRWGFWVLAPFPMAYAMGCILSPLCGCNRSRLREGTRPNRIVKDQTLSTG
jgi:hypothetical protein